jgi:predicted DCC family thiol-disulfide oxidoreductase YuxK
MVTQRSNNFPLTVLYDGACPVCNMEMDNLKARNAQGLLKFVDISAPFFDTTPYGATLADLNKLIHAVRPDGSLVIGVEVLRLAYGAVGLGHLAGPTGWPVFRPVFDVAYAVFARNRYGFSAVFSPVLERVRTVRAAKCSAEMEAAVRKAAAAASACHKGQCDVPDTNLNKRSAS